MSIINLTNSNKSFNNTCLIAVLLALLMVATRPHAISAITHLPDASMAIFFAAGFYLRRYLLFVCYFSLAALLDFLSVTIGNVSSFCISPAYWFLIPAYAVFWQAGILFRRYYALSLRAVLILFVITFISTSISFIISNGSFYFVSGYFTDQNWAEYFTGFKTYYSHYLTSAYAYIASLSCIHFIASHIGKTKESEATGYKDA